MLRCSLGVENMDYTVLSQDGKPAFVVLPYDDFMKMKSNDQAKPVANGNFPLEVLNRNLMNDVPLVKCWREYLNLTQAELADMAGLKQPSLVRIESGKTKPRKATLEKLAKAMNLTLDQLNEDEE